MKPALTSKAGTVATAAAPCQKADARNSVPLRCGIAGSIGGKAAHSSEVHPKVGAKSRKWVWLSGSAAPSVDLIVTGRSRHIPQIRIGSTGLRAGTCIGSARPNRITMSGLRPGNPTGAARSARGPGTSAGWEMWVVFNPCAVACKAKRWQARLICTPCSGLSCAATDAAIPEEGAIWRTCFAFPDLAAKTMSNAYGAIQSGTAGLPLARSSRPSPVCIAAIGLRRSHCFNSGRTAGSANWVELNSVARSHNGLTLARLVIQVIFLLLARNRLFLFRELDFNALCCGFHQPDHERCRGCEIARWRQTLPDKL
jgi:hypothetical protein